MIPSALAGPVVARAAARDEARAFRPGRLNRIRAFFENMVREGEIAGISYIVIRDGKTQCRETVGYANSTTRTPLRDDAIYRIYSMTKPIASVALMMLYEEGQFGLDDPLSRHIEGFADMRVLRTPESSIEDTVPATNEPTIHDLFRHTAGFTHGFSPLTSAVDKAYEDAGLFELDLTLEAEIERLSHIPLAHQPGTRFEYSISPDVQARLVEIFSGVSFEQFLKTRLFAPLGMKDTGFWVPANDAARFVPINWPKDGNLKACEGAQSCPPEDHFLFRTDNINSYTARHAHMSGSYGLVSTLDDYARFAQMMLNGGALDGNRILGNRTVQFMAMNHLGPVKIPARDGWPSGSGWGLGFGTVEKPALTGEMASVGTYYWGGFAGTTFWIDPKENMIVVAMTQHVNNPGVERAITALKAMVYGAISK